MPERKSVDAAAYSNGLAGFPQQFFVNESPLSEDLKNDILSLVPPPLKPTAIYTTLLLAGVVAILALCASVLILEGYPLSIVLNDDALSVDFLKFIQLPAFSKM